jgi:hypothetical protein
VQAYGLYLSSHFEVNPDIEDGSVRASYWCERERGRASSSMARQSSGCMPGGQGRAASHAKIPIVPFEFCPPPGVVNRDPLHAEEAPRLVKGERGARLKRTATARNEHPGNQQVDWLGPQDDSQVFASGGVGTGASSTLSTTEQARSVLSRESGRYGIRYSGRAEPFSTVPVSAQPSQLLLRMWP